MVVYSKIHEVLPNDYWMVVSCGVAGIFVNYWQMSKVMKARKQFKVEVGHQEKCWDF
jgi:hypothetical protein